MTDKLRDALRRVQYEAASLADAQVIALEALAQPAATNGSISDRAQAGKDAGMWAQPAASGEAPEPDMRHPKIQRLIGAKARYELELRLVEQLIEDPECDLTAMEMEYWGPMHDRLKSALSAHPPVVPEPEPLADARIEAMWRNTFSTSNPFCPCDLKSFTKAARATEWAVRAQYAALRAPQPKEQT